MANDSSTGGYLAPVAASPPETDKDLDTILQAMVTGISGLPGNLVRPRWQPTVPKQPEPTTNWCAIGIQRQVLVDMPYIAHDGTGNGQDNFMRYEEIDLLCSFYGPQGMQYASAVRDGIYIPQNSEAIKQHNMAFIGASDIIPAPDFVNQQWIRRFDMTIRLRRQITRTYQVLNILSAETQVTPDSF
ncbi:phage neck terminator protein [Silvimonas soli]|uniref:phage neck terminator protein n=1 Tax=Silvimonas soli TaxID=2980100 RepID=UPI0024B3C45F|nr:hypothetical protein [Silvimonas soli]